MILLFFCRRLTCDMKYANHILIGTLAEKRCAALRPNETDQLNNYCRYIIYILRYMLDDVFKSVHSLKE